MFDDAALVLEEIAPEDKTRNEVLGARVNLYMAAKKWDMAAAVASHLVKVEPENAGWWISLAYALRRTESVEKAEAILLRAQAIHPKVAMIAFNLACYASVTGRMEEAKERLRHAIELDKDVRRLALDDEDLKPFGIGSPVWSNLAGRRSGSSSHCGSLTAYNFRCAGARASFGVSGVLCLSMPPHIELKMILRMASSLLVCSLSSASQRNCACQISSVTIRRPYQVDRILAVL